MNAAAMLFARTATTSVATAHTQVFDLFGAWSELPSVVLEGPAAAVGTQGRVVLFAVGTDGLYVNRQVAAGGDQPFGTWEALGG